jgi:hypothetical protein
MAFRRASVVFVRAGVSGHGDLAYSALASFRMGMVLCGFEATERIQHLFHSYSQKLLTRIREPT